MGNPPWQAGRGVVQCGAGQGRVGWASYLTLASRDGVGIPPWPAGGSGAGQEGYSTLASCGWGVGGSVTPPWPAGEGTGW